MLRVLPDPRAPLGYRHDGRPIFPILGAAPNDLSAQPGNPGTGTSPDTGTRTVVDQDTLSRLLAREKDQGGRTAVKRLLDQLGFDKPDDLTAFVTAQREMQQAQLTEVERRERAAETAAEAAKQREAAAAAKECAFVRRSALVTLGASGDNLADAERLLAVDDDADEPAVVNAATALKARRPELFGTHPAPPPPAPGGSPAGGPPPRGSGQPKARSAGLAMAKRRGYLAD
ncbi:hypothetical protein SRB5_15560 [Streptomyces sp. RB5]|uniref:Uncharacterized protein n=1 Tax=Streptomyces smaragdinus TaxID=2585196 RepID=A0A7K0CDA3_9ACTN|nr:hypothetical protein [Streptomyces smaragdinus]MQY11438.1 hypothetical protein [Streptomyces smaragdinus]